MPPAGTQAPGWEKTQGLLFSRGTEGAGEIRIPAWPGHLGHSPGRSRKILCAYTIAWARSREPVLAKIWLMWVLTVDRLTNSWLAISALDRPWAIRVSTSPSRSVSPSGSAPGGAAGPGPPPHGSPRGGRTTRG